MSILDRDITNRLDRSRHANSLTYVDETDNGERRCLVDHTIESNVYTYDLKRPHTGRHIVSIESVRVTGWTLSEGTGPAGCDQLVFAPASLPDVGSVLRIAYTYYGNPAGEWYGRRTEIDLDEENDPLVYTTRGDETLWHIAGRRDTYDDPAMWWVLADANPGLNGVFQAMLSPMPEGVDLDLPTEGDVLIQLDGLFDL